MLKKLRRLLLCSTLSVVGVPLIQHFDGSSGAADCLG